MAKKSEKLVHNTPVGRLRYPKLNEPDYGTDDYPKPAGEYSAQVILSEADAKPLLEILEPLLKEAVDDGKTKFKALKPAAKKKLKELTINDVFANEYDDDGEETGNLIFKIKTTASGENKKTGKPWKRRVAIYDAKCNIMKSPPQIWSGTRAKCAFKTASYFIASSGACGISLYLDAVQITDLVSDGAREASVYGFGEEDGYEYDESEAADDDKGDDGGVESGDGGDADASDEEMF